MNTDLNKEIAQFFLDDSRDFLQRYFLLREATFTHMSGRSKLLLDLLFSIECSLKALIFIESSEDEKNTYKKIKIHDLDKLINILNEETKLQCSQFITGKLNDYYVGIRYSLESHISFRTEQGVLGEKYYSTIANFDWLDDVYEKSKSLLEYASSRNLVSIKVIRLNDVDIQYELCKHSRFKGMCD